MQSLSIPFEPTQLKEILPLILFGMKAPLSAIKLSLSSSLNTRSAAMIPRCIVLTLSAMNRSGQNSILISIIKELITPTEA